MVKRRDYSRTITYRMRTTPAFGWKPWITERVSSYEEMFSFNHAPINVTGDDGGPWQLNRYLDSPDVGYCNGYDSTLQGDYIIQKPPTHTWWSGVTSASNSQLDADGTTAISRVAPTNPSFSLSTSLGELASDGLPSLAGVSLWKERAQLARGAGSEYLNTQFGWLPLISDIRKFASAVKESDEILRSYRKGSDTKIRRGYDFPSDTSVRVTTHGNMYTFPVWKQGPGTIIESKLSRRWFRGAFRYHIPTNDTQLGKFQEWASMSDHLLGWKVTPETLWNIAPWSWAIDWFTNTGDVMTNISALGKDGLVMQYGYQMAHTRHEKFLTAAIWRNSQQGTENLTRRYITEFKQRRPATPFGFGTNLTTLSPRQIAIITALGLSRT